MRFTVLNLDVVRDTKDMLGWNISDTHQVGTIDVSDEVWQDDYLLLDVLNAAGYVDNLNAEDVYFMIESDFLELRDEETERPILGLVVEQ